jgi:hypothetical protein
MKQRNLGQSDSCGTSRKEEAMFRPFDNDDWDLTDTHHGPAGEPDAEDADSMACWFGGLLEDPLDDFDSSEADDCDNDESVFFPGSEECGEPTTDTLEGCDER